MSLGSRSFGRIRTARIVLLVLAVLLALVVAVTIWSRRPQKRARAAGPPAPAAPSDALQAIETFRFTSTVSGKKTWTIVADRLLGVSEGVHTLDRIREIELVRPDGKILRGSADRGTFVEGEETAPGTGRGRGRVVLEGNVRIEGSEGEELLSQRIEYDQASQTLLSPGACSFRYRPRADGKEAPPPMEGEANRLAYDLAANRAALDGGVLLRLQEAGEPETLVRAARAELAVDASVATFSGGMTIEHGEDKLSAPQGRVERGASGAGRLEAGPGAAARLVRAAGVAPTRAAADRITVEQRASSAGAGRTVTLAGSASIEEGAAPASAPSAAGPADAQRLSADTITVIEAAAGAPRPVRAAGHVALRLPPAPGESAPRTITCAALDGALEPDGRLREADATGGVVIHAGLRTATSDSARFFGETRVELRGARPRVEEAGRTLVADEIDLVRPAENAPSPSGGTTVTARGQVRARFTPRTESTGGPVAPGQPVDTTSGPAEFHDGARTALFTGKVLARQAERALSAARLLVNDADRTVSAEGSVSLRTFRLQDGRAASSAAAPAPSLPAASAKPVPVHVVADRLFHDERAKTTRFEGRAVYREPGRSLAADRITMVGGSGGASSRTFAEGHVTVDGEGKTGEGDRAEHDAASRSITLTGTDRPARVTETATGRAWRGPSLTWSLTPDSIPVASGEAGRSTITAPGSGGERNVIDRPTDSRSAR